MKQWIQDLLTLQSFDLRVRNLEIKLQTIPSERAKLVAEFEVVKKALQDAQDLQRRLDLEIKQTQAKNQEAAENLHKMQTHSLSVKKNSEYQAILQEIERIKGIISDLETKELELMDQAEAAAVNEKKVHKNYNATGRAIQSELKDFESLKVDILKEIEENKIKSKQMDPLIEQDLLAIYKRLIASGKGTPLVPVSEANMCMNCNMKVTPQTLNSISKGVVTLCDNCSHLLYKPELVPH